MTTRSLNDRVTALEGTVASLQNLPHELASFRRDADTRFEAIDTRFEAIDRRFEAIDRRFDAVDARFDRLEQRMADDKAELYAHMRMLHEDLVARIALIGERRRRKKR